MSKHICKICNQELVKIHSYKFTPNKAQYLSDIPLQLLDQSIDLFIYQCPFCGIVQIPQNPVFYYDRAIRSIDWDNDSFRKKQKTDFINQFNLFNKEIKYVDYRPTTSNYDAFLMFNYLQHFPNPKQTLKQIYKNLSENGVGIIQVPNFDEIIEQGIFGQFIIDHLFYFTKRSLNTILQNSGFQVIRIQEIWEGASLSATVRKRKLINSKIFIDNQKKLINDMDQFVSKHNNVAIWGAGHQTLMMLPMLKNINKIKYIIDDFEEKQNKYTPVTYKKIYSSQILKTDDSIDAIIIIVGWQYRSVIKKINNKNKIKFAIIKKATLELLDVKD